MSKPLSGKVALVTGGSRGIGKGIAFELSKAGAIVYATGRSPSSRDQVKAAGTLEDLVNEAEEVGGKIIPVFCDHTNDEQVRELFKKIEKEQDGRLDLLVNNAVANVTYGIKNLGKKFYELSEDPGYSYDIFNNAGLRGNYICSVLAAKLMIPRKSGLILTIGSPGSVKYLFSVLYGVQKEANDRMIADMAIELQGTGVHCINFHPGPVETEAAQELVENKELFAGGESIYFAGRCLAKLLEDPEYIKSQNGHVVLTSELSERYDVRDLNGEKVKHQAQIALRPLYDAMDKIHTRELQQ